METDIAAINSRISALAPILPPSQQQQQQQLQQQSQLTTKAITAVKPTIASSTDIQLKAKCKTKGEKAKCKQCPTGICTNIPSSSRCNCEWHRKQSQTQPTNTQPLAQQQLHVHVQTPVPQVTLQVRSHGSIKEWLLPPQICQSMIFGFPQGSI